MDIAPLPEDFATAKEDSPGNGAAKRHGKSLGTSPSLEAAWHRILEHGCQRAEYSRVCSQGLWEG